MKQKTEMFINNNENHYNGSAMIIVKREYVINIKKLEEQLSFEEGIKSHRFFKKGIKLIRAMKMVEFRSEIDFDKPLLYVKPLPIHEAPFVLQSDRIVTKAENERKANELIDIFISKHRI